MSATTTKTVLGPVRYQILKEGGSSATDVITAALDRWAAGDTRAALRLMWDDGADRDWLLRFMMLLGESGGVTMALIDEVAAFDDF